MRNYLILLIVLAISLSLACDKTKVRPLREIPKIPRGERESLPEQEEKPKQEKPTGELEPVQRIVLEDIHFEFDKYELTDEAKKILTENARKLMENPHLKILIEGHCDERGTQEYNLALGEKRALAARDFLVRFGIAKSRISVISYGEERPLDPRHNEEAWAKNRRAHFVIIKQGAGIE